MITVTKSKKAHSEKSYVKGGLSDGSFGVKGKKSYQAVVKVSNAGRSVVVRQASTHVKCGSPDLSDCISKEDAELINSVALAAARHLVSSK